MANEEYYHRVSTCFDMFRQNLCDWEKDRISLPYNRLKYFLFLLQIYQCQSIIVSIFSQLKKVIVMGMSGSEQLEMWWRCVIKQLKAKSITRKAMKSKLPKIIKLNRHCYYYYYSYNERYYIYVIFGVLTSSFH